MTEVSYNDFRNLHKGTPQKEISKLWKQYKKGSYEIPSQKEGHSFEPTEEVLIEETPDTIEETTEVVITVPKVPENKKELTKLDKCHEFERFRKALERFPMRYNEEETNKILQKMKEYANETIPESYTCEPTDSWKVWFGPTQDCLLINTTRQVAFKADRSWWKVNYQSTIYVDRELLDDNTLMELERMRYAKKGSYIPRTPIVGVECKLPRSVKEIRIKGGQAGDN